MLVVNLCPFSIKRQENSILIFLKVIEVRIKAHIGKVVSQDILADALSILFVDIDNNPFKKILNGRLDYVHNCPDFVLLWLTAH